MQGSYESLPRGLLTTSSKLQGPHQKWQLELKTEPFLGQTVHCPFQLPFRQLQTMFMFQRRGINEGHQGTKTGGERPRERNNTGKEGTAGKKNRGLQEEKQGGKKGHERQGTRNTDTKKDWGRTRKNQGEKAELRLNRERDREKKPKKGKLQRREGKKNRTRASANTTSSTSCLCYHLLRPEQGGNREKPG